jgi:hypothetical protein
MLEDGPPRRQFGSRRYKFEASARPTIVFKPWGQDSIGPSSDFDQSFAPINDAILPSPKNK